MEFEAGALADEPGNDSGWLGAPESCSGRGMRKDIREVQGAQKPRPMEPHPGSVSCS